MINLGDQLRRPRVLLLALLLLLGGSCAAVQAWWKADPVARIDALREQLDAPDLSRDRRQELEGEIDRHVAQLTPAQKWQVLRGEYRRHLDAFFALSPAQQRAQLDRTLDHLKKQGAGAARDGVAFGAAAPAGPPVRMGLESTTPHERAQAARYLKMLADRARQRGLPLPQTNVLLINLQAR